MEGLPWLKREELLTYEEIARIVRTMTEMGLRRVRITGGEPLVRRDLPDLVSMISEVPEIEDLSLSTNAVLLAEQADALRDAGIQRLNVSLDSLRPDRVDSIARRPGSYPKIMEGLDAAEASGFAPIKINVVLIRGQNDDEIEDFAEITRERPWHVRFIEMMPTGANLDLSANQFISCTEVYVVFGESNLLSRCRGRSETVRPILPVQGCAWYHRCDHSHEPIIGSV